MVFRCVDCSIPCLKNQGFEADFLHSATNGGAMCAYDCAICTNFMDIYVKILFLQRTVAVLINKLLTALFVLIFSVCCVIMVT